MPIFDDESEKKAIPRLHRLKMPEKQRSEMSPEEQLASPEEGSHEQGYIETVEDALTQGKDQLGPDVKSGAVGIGPLEKSAESVAEKLLRPKLWAEAMRDSGKLQALGRDAKGAEAEYQAGRKALRAGAQELKDVKEGVKTAGMGAEAKPYAGDLVTDLKSAEKSRIAKLRENAGPDLDYSKMSVPAEQAEATTLDYSKFPKSKGAGSSGKKLKYSGRKISMENDE